RISGRTEHSTEPGHAPWSRRRRCPDGRVPVPGVEDAGSTSRAGGGRRSPPAVGPARGKMQIHTDLAPAGPYDDVVVLIDVLRTGTLAPMLLDLGLTRFALTASVRRARQETDADPSVLLMGERGGFPPERFNHGTSPAVLRLIDVRGRAAVILTENAPRAMAAAAGAPVVVLGSILNARAAVALAAERSRGKVYLVCSGFAGEPDLDDTLAAGLMAGMLRERVAD